jgi:hypothetical protein
LGISGIGKTAFTLKLIEQIKSNFNYVIYRSLHTLPTLTEITKDIIKLMSPESINNLNINPENELSLLKNYLSNHCCLIILDDIQEIFSQGKLVGNYQENYENYQKLFKLFAEFNQQNCLILVSQELPLEIVNLSEDNPHCASLILGSLGESAREILQEKQLLDEGKWEELINFYEGNPAYLKIIARLIKQMFAGKIENFLEYSSQPFLDESIQAILRKQIAKITNEEKEVLQILSQEKKPVSLSKLKALLNIDMLLNCLQSLERRNLMNQQIIDNQNVFNINLILQKYFNNKI